MRAHCIRHRPGQHCCCSLQCLGTAAGHKRSTPFPNCGVSKILPKSSAVDIKGARGLRVCAETAGFGYSNSGLLDDEISCALFACSGKCNGLHHIFWRFLRVRNTRTEARLPVRCLQALSQCHSERCPHYGLYEEQHVGTEPSLPRAVQIAQLDESFSGTDLITIKVQSSSERETGLLCVGARMKCSGWRVPAVRR